MVADMKVAGLVVVGTSVSPACRVGAMAITSHIKISPLIVQPSFSTT